MLFLYFLRLRTNAATRTATMTIAATIATYVVIGIPLVGCGAGLGEEIIMVGAGVVVGVTLAG